MLLLQLHPATVLVEEGDAGGFEGGAEDLADHSEVGANTIKKFETDATKAPHKSTLKVLRATFEAHGVGFTDEGSGGLWLKG